MQFQQLDFEIIKVEALRPVVRILIEVTENHAVLFPPVGEARVHGLMLKGGGGYVKTFG